MSSYPPAHSPVVDDGVWNAAAHVKQLVALSHVAQPVPQAE